MQRIICTVTNDLAFDQRMQRICSSLAMAGYAVTLVGRSLPDSPPLPSMPFEQVRIDCRYHTGKLFYLEYNYRLYRYLKKQKADALYAVDLDTILPVLQVSKQQKIPRLYDAHELFTELTEVKRRPLIFKIWSWVERKAVPQFAHGYTVNQFIADELQRRYKVHYGIVRNVPKRITTSKASTSTSFTNLPKKFFLYQGAVNEGRSFETLIPAMKWVNIPLVIAGNGNFYNQAIELTKEHQLEDKIIFLGYVKPAELKLLTPKAFAGLTLFDNTGLNQYYSLANRFFDYIQGGIPQLCVDYPEYAVINQQYNIAVLTNNLTANGIATRLNELLQNEALYTELKSNCVLAANELCWENEEKKLLSIWQQILPLP